MEGEEQHLIAVDGGRYEPRIHDEPEMQLLPLEATEDGGERVQEGSEGFAVPEAGLVFDTVDSAVEFYKEYGKRKGFGVSIRNSMLTADGKYQRLRLACTREGFPRSKIRRKAAVFASQKAGCKAKMTLVRSPDGDGKYVVSMVTLEHSHDLSPSKGRHFRCNRSISLGVKRRLEINNNAGIRVSHNYASIMQECGGFQNMSFSERDCRNYLDRLRHLQIAEGDGEAVRRYFEVMQIQSPNYFSKIELDNNQRVRSLFWADGRTRATYQYFNDVVAFDTTYLTNRYDMPFAPFCGVNHHGQTIMLGCGLLVSETVESFVWLFLTWLECMGGVQPKAIITDQCRAIKKAVEIVFTNSRHRCCIWHIRQKLPQKLGALLTYRELEKAFSMLVYKCHDRIEFEEKWVAMIREHGLEDNHWLQQLYEDREMWAPAFLNDTFWAGMASTQRSEGLNAFFDGFVNSRTSLFTFVEQYALAQRRKIEKEAEADFHSYQNVVQCVTNLTYEKQFQSAYTQSKFIEIQEEMREILGIFPEDVGNCEPLCKIFRCNEREGRTENVYFHIEKNEFECSCRCFEFRGIVCRHAFAVLLRQRVEEVNRKYILERWRKDIRRRYNYETIFCIPHDQRPEVRRYEEVHHIMLQVAEMASANNDMTSYVKDEATKLLSNLDRWKSEVHNNSPDSSSFRARKSDMASKKFDIDKIGGEDGNCLKINDAAKPILNPTRKKRRGRPATNRIKGVMEKLNQRLRNTRGRGLPKSSGRGNDCRTILQRGKRTIEESKFASLEEVLNNSGVCGAETNLQGKKKKIDHGHMSADFIPTKKHRLQKGEAIIHTEHGGDIDNGTFTASTLCDPLRRSSRLKKHDN